MHINLSGKVALITGVSRQQGIGAAIAKQLAQAGATIFTTYFRPYDQEIGLSQGTHEAAEILEEVGGLGVEAAGMEADLSDADAAARIFAAAIAQFGQVDILVNNATRDTPANIDTVDAATMDDHLAINVRGTLLLCQQFAKHFRGPSGGRIINMTSGQGLTPMPDSLPYVASKGAIEALTLSLAPTLMRRGITINAVDPGATDSGWIDAALHAQLVAQSPSGRVGLPADAARLVCFLAADEAAWITGQILRSRGGM